MFNLTNMSIGNTTLNFNAVGETLIKSAPKSKFKKFHSNSVVAGRVFDSAKPTLTAEYDAKEIIVLQVMLFGNEELLIEFMFKEDTEGEFDG